MKRILLVICILASAILFLPSAEAALITYEADLTGPNESPPNASPGTGYALVDIDTVAETMHVQASFSGLPGTTTASHIHATTAVPGVGIAGVATQTPTFVGFPLGVTSGTYDHLFDLTLASTYRAGFITDNGGTAANAEAALLLAMANGEAYFNIHRKCSPVLPVELRGPVRSWPAPASCRTMRRPRSATLEP